MSYHCYQMKRRILKSVQTRLTRRMNSCFFSSCPWKGTSGTSLVPCSLGELLQLTCSRLHCLLQLANLLLVLSFGIAVTLGVATEFLLVVTLIRTIVGVMTLPFSFRHPSLLAHPTIACLALRGLLLRRLRFLVLLVPFGVDHVISSAG